MITNSDLERLENVINNFASKEKIMKEIRKEFNIPLPPKTYMLTIEIQSTNPEETDKWDLTDWKYVLRNEGFSGYNGKDWKSYLTAPKVSFGKVI